MAGKARVHELAKELGLSSKQVLSKLQDLGEYVKSPSSTVDAAVARRLRDAMTGKGQPGPTRRSWPHAAGNNPYSPPTTHPCAAPPEHRTPPRPTTPPPAPMSPRPRTDDTSFAADLARARADSKKSKPTGKRHPPKVPPLATFIAQHTGRGGFHDPLNMEIATGWAMQWHSNAYEYDDAVPWMQAGLNGNEADTARDMYRAGWTPATLHRTVNGETVLEVWRKGVFSIEDINRMLREQDGDETT